MKRIGILSVVVAIGICPGLATAQSPSAEQQLTLCRDLYQVVIGARSQAEGLAAQLKGERDAAKAELEALKQKIEKEKPKESKAP